MTVEYKPYRAECSAAGCAEAAEYKIAAQWTDGSLTELKPYGFSCEGHLPEIVRDARTRKARCRLSPGESCGEVGVYRFRPNTKDQQLERLGDLERLAEKDSGKTVSKSKGNP